ncbi:PREDICTED: beta-amylase 8-like [Ipomoea nil]|uniref:beta-amylase 8-like n=1 Tax=Ipomoea nil TaxID=35883 RepID=UPI0009012294|nr:PREDICTED: beta-amylase 8-like [Ipomoea nil]
MSGNAASATANKSRKFLERNRRAFTARMLAGLRQYSNFNLQPRAEMNKVTAALAREAGFTVEPDGTTYGSAASSNVSGIINNFCQLVDPGGVKQELQLLKSLNIDVVVVNCWWGIVEGKEDQKYKWSGYRELFDIIRDKGLKLQVVIAFNAYGGNDFKVDIPLPQWVLKIGKDIPEIFFTGRVGRWNTECLSWGIDKECILEHRTGREGCYEFMRSFRAEFNDLFTKGLISAVEIGLGAFGESKYPSFSERNGWRFPGIVS